MMHLNKNLVGWLGTKIDWIFEPPPYECKNWSRHYDKMATIAHGILACDYVPNPYRMVVTNSWQAKNK